MQRFAPALILPKLRPPMYSLYHASLAQGKIRRATLMTVEGRGMLCKANLDPSLARKHGSHPLEAVVSPEVRKGRAEQCKGQACR